MNEVLTLSGTAQARLIQNGAISSTELVQTHIDRIRAVNPVLNAAVEILERTALAEARSADARYAQGAPLSPLDGVPFSVKDSIEVAGTVCTAGTLGRRNAPASTCDATLVARLRSAGAIPIVRTNLPDLLFAFETENLIHGRTNNPYDVTRTSGGSSGGEAALIAACGSPFGLGSDAAGSVRVPAHYCGIASIKPTSGRLPRAGHVPPPSGWIEILWQIGPMARHVDDLIALMPLLTESEWGRPPACRRIASFIENGIAPVTPETAAIVRTAAKALANAGMIVEERTPPYIDQSYDLEMQLIGPDGGDALRQYLRDIGSHQTHPLLDAWLANLEPYRTTLKGFAECWSRLDQFRAGFSTFMQDFDAILSPVSSTPAVPHGTSIDPAIFRGYSYTMTHNLTGWPAAVVRCGESKEGLPIGVQIAAKPGREDITLAIASRLEATFGGWKPAI
ncbi:MAG TPA: amidase family protein [Bryobacteraceae bacterium]|nr:amidase family protein [Bryobacteraceae bacterium]